jgi:hypothetical protein
MTVWEVLLRRHTDGDTFTTTVLVFRLPATPPPQDNSRSNLWLPMQHPHTNSSTYRKLVSFSFDCFYIHTTHTGYHELHQRHHHHHSSTTTAMLTFFPNNFATHFTFSLSLPCIKSPHAFPDSGCLDYQQPQGDISFVRVRSELHKVSNG